VEWRRRRRVIPQNVYITPRTRMAKKTNADGFLDFIHGQIMSLNNSKFFAGLVIISLNIASKFVTIKLSKTTETYLRYTFSRQIIIFAMAWMATRDIYMALILTACFVVLADYLFNENSRFCCFSDNFKQKYLSMDSSTAPTTTQTTPNPYSPTEDDIKKSIAILEQVREQNKQKDTPNYNTPFSLLR
jgi:hypothetical protein